MRGSKERHSLLLIMYLACRHNFGHGIIIFTWNASMGKAWTSGSWGTIDFFTAAFGLRALVTTDLDHTLEVDIHGVGELESLEVGIGHDGSGGSKVLDFVESGHDLGPCHTTVSIDKLNRCAFTIVSNAVTNQHVEFIFIVFNGEYHGHCLTNLHNSRYFRSPWTLSNLFAQTV